ANNNTIGGNVAGAGNTISGNQSDGVRVQTTGNTIQGNTIGTLVGGSGAVLNNGYGVSLENNTNTVGGSAAAERNTISGNASGGINVFATGNVVKGNYIGTNGSGTASLGTFFVPGVNVASGASNTQIGGTAAGE